MSSPAVIKLTDLAAVLGGLVATYFTVGYLMDKFPLRIGVMALPPGPVLPPAPTSAPPPPPKPRLMTETPLPLVSGRRYGVSLDMPAVFSDGMAKSAAGSLGFNNVDVYDKPPPGWPGNTGKSNANTWVVGFYSGPPTTMPRSKMGVDVIEAFEG